MLIWDKKMDKRAGILIVSVTFLVLCFVGTASAGTLYLDDDGGADFTGIQETINTASVGDTIIVHSGVYYENVVVDKSVTLIGIGHPVVDACGEGSAITLCADGITLIGFTATNSGSSWGCAGIKVISSNNIITGNNVSNNDRNGIYLDYSSNNNNNIITGNNANNNGDGIYLDYSCNNNTITGNNVSNNDRNGIGLYSSSNNNTITRNTFLNDGLFVSSCSYQNTVEDNTVNGKPLVYLEDASDYKVEDAGQVILVNCDNITVENLDLSNTSVGIELLNTENSKIINNNISKNNVDGFYLWYSCNNSITGNNVNNNWDGISLWDSSNNNTITGNNVSNNWDGISLSLSSNNTITGNNVSNNWDGIFLYDSNNNNIITGNNVSSNDRNGISLWDSSNNNTITGNNASNNWGGIFLSLSSNNTITGNNVNNNWDGIYLLASNNNNTITGNNVNNNWNGIHLYYYSSNNTITGNNVSNNSDGGIYLFYSSNNNTITGNVFVNDGLNVEYSYQNTVEDNTVNGKPLVYLEDASDFRVNDAGQVILVNCTNITVENLDLSNTSVGIELHVTEDSKVLNNTVSNNSRDGIRLWDSSNNTIYFNNFINNTNNVFLYTSTNIWNSPLEISYTYDGTTYESYLGNYWDDYEGTDADGDGIGSIPYSIDSESDECDDYPLMQPFENYNIPRSAPA
jgi:parallel beta-helix repeat protein